jgi:hypothetical protein
MDTVVQLLAHPPCHHGEVADPRKDAANDVIRLDSSIFACVSRVQQRRSLAERNVIKVLRRDYHSSYTTAGCEAMYIFRIICTLPSVTGAHF